MNVIYYYREELDGFPIDFEAPINTYMESFGHLQCCFNDIKAYLKCIDKTSYEILNECLIADADSTQIVRLVNHLKIKDMLRPSPEFNASFLEYFHKFNGISTKLFKFILEDNSLVKEKEKDYVKEFLLLHATQSLILPTPRN